MRRKGFPVQEFEWVELVPSIFLCGMCVVGIRSKVARCFASVCCQAVALGTMEERHSETSSAYAGHPKEQSA